MHYNEKPRLTRCGREGAPKGALKGSLKCALEGSLKLFRALLRALLGALDVAPCQLKHVMALTKPETATRGG